MLNTNEFDMHPILVWRSLDRTQRATLIAVTIALLAFGIGFYMLFGSAAMSAM
jgi:hypothetical protein